MDECSFCAIVAGRAPAELIDADEVAVTFMDIRPATPGHCLVVPRRHVPDLCSVDGDGAAAVMRAAHRAAQRIQSALQPAGLNLWQSNGRAATQTVFHLHVHVIPRYHGDGLRLPWVPTLGDAAGIAATARRLRGS